MNKSAKGFGLVGVIAAVIVMMISAMFSAQAEAAMTESNLLTGIVSNQ